MNEPLRTTVPRDLLGGLVVFVVALPLCLGVALASGTPLLSGIISGIVGGIVVGYLSRSQTSVSGPAAGLTAVVLAEVAACGSFEAFLVAVMLAGLIQIGMGLLGAGGIAKFVPSSVLTGLLAAIGIILILKQIPHLVGHDQDPEGDWAFNQPDNNNNTFSELWETILDLHPGAALVGLTCLALLILWDNFRSLKKSPIPAPLLVVLLGVGLAEILQYVGGIWVIEASHLVQVPVPATMREFVGFLDFPDFTAIVKPAVLLAGVTLAIVASLETLLNLEAVDKLDPKQRSSPANRELIAQGVGNVTSALLGGIPVTSVIVRSSVNINAGSKTKLAAIWHGMLLFICVVFLPTWLNLIPLSCLAAILLHTGAKLAHPKTFKKLWRQGWTRFLPFIGTVVAIVLTDLLIGILIGLCVSIAFILRSNLRRPLLRVVEKHVGGEVLHLQLANQVSFLNRASIADTLDAIPLGGHVLIDAESTDYIDPDILDLILTYRDQTAPVRNVHVSLVGFRDEYRLRDTILFADYTSREVRASLTPDAVLELLKEGNGRFLTGQRINRDLNRQLSATAAGQFPIAAILSCIDSRAPVEILFDLGLGDLFTVRIAGNVGREKVLGSLEYACVVAGAKLIVVMGHSRCGAVRAAVEFAISGTTALEATGCKHLQAIIEEVSVSIDPATIHALKSATPARVNEYADEVARINVRRTFNKICRDSESLARLLNAGTIRIVAAFYDVVTGKVEFEDVEVTARKQV